MKSIDKRHRARVVSHPTPKEPPRGTSVPPLDRGNRRIRLVSSPRDGSGRRARLRAAFTPQPLEHTFRPLEQLEDRVLFAASPPPGFGLVEHVRVDLGADSAAIHSTLLEEDRSYHARITGVSGAATIGQTRDRTGERKTDGAYTQAIDDLSEWRNWSDGRLSVMLGEDRSTSKVNWGGHNGNGTYGTDFTGGGGKFSTKYHEFKSGYYSDNVGEVKVELWEQILVDSLTVTSSVDSTRSSEVARSDSLGTTAPEALYLGLPRSGGHEVSVGLDASRNQSSFESSMIKWMVEGGATTGSSSGSGFTPSTLSLLDAASYTFSAWVDFESNGRVDGDEPSISLSVNTVAVNELDVASDAHRENSVNGAAVGPSQILYVELEDDTDSTPLFLDATLVGPAGGDLELRYAVVGGAGSEGAFSGTTSRDATLTGAGETHTVAAGFDLDGDGMLAESEFGVEVAAVLVEIDELYVEDSTNQKFSVQTASKSDKSELFVWEDPTKSQAEIGIDVFGTPVSTAAGANVLWQIVGGEVEGESSGNFGTEDPRKKLKPSATGRNYRVELGFDDNGDGKLGEGEVSRTVIVSPVLVDLFAYTQGETVLGDTVSYVSGMEIGGSGLVAVESVDFYGRVEDGAWKLAYASEDANAVYKRKETVAGAIEWSVVVTVGGRAFSSVSDDPDKSIVKVQVEFPQVRDYISDTNLRYQMYDWWQLSKEPNNNNETRRRELGFWILYDTDSGKYLRGRQVFGEYVSNDILSSTSGAGKIEPGKIDDRGVAGASVVDTPLYSVGFFHTHTSLAYSSGARRVGLSPYDIAYQDHDDHPIPVIAYDYVGEDGIHKAEHDIDSAAGLYYEELRRRKW